MSRCTTKNNVLGRRLFSKGFEYLFVQFEFVIKLYLFIHFRMA